MDSEEMKETTDPILIPDQPKNDFDLSNLSKTQLIEMLSRLKHQNSETKRQIKKAKDAQARISNQGEAEEEFISNKLALKLEKVQREKAEIIKKVQVEEEHINNYLHKKLTDLSRERLEIET